MSDNGIKYAKALLDFFKNEHVDDLRIWSSQKVRAAQTAKELAPLAAHIEYWKALDEIDAGVCEGLTYEDIEQRYPSQAQDRVRDKYHFRFPSGESYEDVVARLEPVIMELERQTNVLLVSHQADVVARLEPVIMELERQTNVLLVSHQAVLRCILAYFDERPLDLLPFLNMPLHTLIKLTPIAYGCETTYYQFVTDESDENQGRVSAFQNLSTH
ncbi:unnamed protein product [Anisakis simplex]|uniref:Uncharacterized protein n=1 Tax=Anisakis simplex TaxID=6269 RepID=A0A3P6SLE9_ANISI|nr:unnamed protein product [Anisakis simplex]